MSSREITEFVNARLEPKYALSLPAIEKYIIESRQEGRNWMFRMNVDVYEYADQIKEGWDCICELIRIQWEELDRARASHDYDAEAKASLLICKLNEQRLELASIFPQIALPPSLSSSSTRALPNNNNSENNDYLVKPILDVADTGNGKDNNTILEDVP